MFGLQAQSACTTLQSASDSYILDRLDRALDEISRNPQNTSPAPFQIRSAWANAGKIVDKRRKLVPQVSLDAATVDAQAMIDPPYAAVKIFDWIDRAAVSDTDRKVLRGLAAGTDATGLADAEGVPVQRMRERISRARKAATRGYREDAGVTA